MGPQMLEQSKNLTSGKWQEKSEAINDNASASTEADRLLHFLAQAGAYGFYPTDSRNSLVVVAPRHGVSIRIGSVHRSGAETMLSAGTAVWENPCRSRTRRLVLSPAGWAKMRRFASPADADPFLAQHTSLRRMPKRPSGENAPMRDEGESPLAWLVRRKGRNGQPLLDRAGFDAGERLRRDLTFSAMLPKISANWSESPSVRNGAPAPIHYSDGVIAARQRVEKALKAVGPEFAGLLMDVCGFLKGLEHIEQERGWPPRSARIVLQLALSRLCRHYGMAGDACGPERNGAITHWGTDDYRPHLQALEL
jgi:hypothetical protein